MALGLWYWLILVLWLIFSGWVGLRPNGDRYVFGGSLVVFILLVLLGLKVFGSPVAG